VFAGLVWQEYPDLEIIAKEECIIYSHYTMTMKQYVLLLKLENKPQPTSALFQSTVPTYSTRYVQGKNPDDKDLTRQAYRVVGEDRRSFPQRPIVIISGSSIDTASVSLRCKIVRQFS